MDNKLQIETCKNCVWQSSVFSPLTEAQLDMVSHQKKHVVYLKGSSICRQGEKITHFIYMHKGLLKLFVTSENGRDQIVRLSGPMDFIGLLNTFYEPEYGYSVTAIENSSVCLIPRELMYDLVRQNGEFGLNLLQKSSKTANDIIHQRGLIHRKNLRGRVAYVLNELAGPIYKSPKFDLPVSRREIAELIDMTTENVIRILSEFRKDRIIDISGKTINIVNTELLEKIANHG